MPSHEDLLYWLLTAWANKEPRREQLRQQVLERMCASDPIDCTDCDAKIPREQGIGKVEGVWLDKSKPRPMKITPLCLACMAKRMIHE